MYCLVGINAKAILCYKYSTKGLHAHFLESLITTKLLGVQTIMFLSKGALMSTKVAPLWGSHIVEWFHPTQDIIKDED